MTFVSPGAHPLPYVITIAALLLFGGLLTVQLVLRKEDRERPGPPGKKGGDRAGRPGREVVAVASLAAADSPGPAMVRGETPRQDTISPPETAGPGGGAPGAARSERLPGAEEVPTAPGALDEDQPCCGPGGTCACNDACTCACPGCVCENWGDDGYPHVPAGIGEPDDDAATLTWARSLAVPADTDTLDALVAALDPDQAMWDSLYDQIARTEILIGRARLVLPGGYSLLRPLRRDAQEVLLAEADAVLAVDRALMAVGT